MNLMNRTRPTDSDPVHVIRFPRQSPDVALAASTSAPVLITAPEAMGLRVALDIAAGDRRDGKAVIVIDASDHQNLKAVLTEAEPADGRVRAVILRDVHLLDHAQQAALAKLMADRGRTSRRWRLIATTSVSLFDRVARGVFDSQLFYALNTIHIVL
jgi:transcriptional regulator of acetoin/glycerol metabolism